MDKNGGCFPWKLAPSGKLLHIAIENDHRNSGFTMIYMDLPMKNGDFP